MEPDRYVTKLQMHRIRERWEVAQELIRARDVMRLLTDYRQPVDMGAIQAIQRLEWRYNELTKLVAG